MSAPITQGDDGKFYGTTYEGQGAGTIFQLTAAGKIKFLHIFNQSVDDAGDQVLPVTLGTDGNLYAASNDGCYYGSCGPKSLFEITTKGVYTDLFNNFANPYECNPSVNGCMPSSPLALDPNGLFYGTTWQGGGGRGVFYSFNTGFKPFVSLQFPLGKVGTTLGIFGQGFTTATAVAFNGKAATFTVVSDTYLTATIPTGATKGYVTVTEPSGTLKSSIKFTPKA